MKTHANPQGLNFILAFTAVVALTMTCQPVCADWGLVKVFDFSDGYPGTGVEIGVSGTNPTIHDDIVMFGITGSEQGIFRYERGSLISFADNGPDDSFSSVSVASSDAHNPYGAFVGNRGSGNGIYTRNINTMHVAFPIATPSTDIPSGTEKFTSFGDQSIDDTRVTFIGFGSSSQRGIYAADVNSTSGPSLVIERFSNLPGGSFDSFQSFDALSHRGNTVVFSGNGSSNSGIYFRSVSGFIVAFGTVADTNTNIPGRGSNKFTFFQDPAYDGTATAFHGFGSGISGVYTNQGGPLRTVADTDTPIPGAATNFVGIAAGSVSMDDGDIAFEGVGAGSLRGIYVEKDGVLEKIVATGDIVDGRTVSGVSIGRDGFSNGHAAIRLSFDDFGATFYAAFSEHRWDPPDAAGGYWNSKANWPLGALPGTSAPTYIEPGGSALIHGPTTTTTMHSLTIGAQSSGTAELRLYPSGQILIDHSLTLQPASRLSGEGLLSATAGIINQGTIDLGTNSIALAGGILANHNLIKGQGFIDNTLHNEPTAELRAESSKTITFSGIANQNLGRINLLGGTLDFTNDLTNAPGAQINGRGTLSTGTGLTNQGRINLSAGFTDIFGPVTITPGAQVLVSGGAIATFYDDVTQNGTELRVSSGGWAVFFGHVSGGGDFTGEGTIQFEGTFSPGSSPADVTIEADTTLAASSNLILEIAGMIPGDEHDQLTFTNHLHVAGTLTIDLLDDYHPTLGDTFQLLNFASTTGDFAAINLPALHPALAFDTSELLTTGALTVVPEPTTVLLLICITPLITRHDPRSQHMARRLI